MNLKLTDIRTDGGTQPRAVIDTLLATQYAEAMVDGATFPPAVVFFDGASYWLADGFHRYHAHVGCGRAEMDCDVRQGTQRDAILHSVGANAEHGWRRTPDDKRRAVMRLLNDPEWSQWVDIEIARRCKVDHKTVASLRRRVTWEFPSDRPKRTYKDRWGNISTMDVSGIGPKTTPAAEPAGLPPDSDKLFICPSCSEEFREQVWHCQWCDHHWLMHETQCRNCYRDRNADTPIAREEEDDEEDDAPFISIGDRNISAAIWEIRDQIDSLPSPEEAMRLFKPTHYHTITSAKLRSMAGWISEFADRYSEVEKEQRDVAAE